MILNCLLFFVSTLSFDIPSPICLSNELTPKPKTPAIIKTASEAAQDLGKENSAEENLPAASTLSDQGLDKENKQQPESVQKLQPAFLDEALDINIEGRILTWRVDLETTLIFQKR